MLLSVQLAERIQVRVWCFSKTIVLSAHARQALRVLKRQTDLLHTANSQCRDPGSNRGPSDLRSDALPAELSRLDSSVPRLDLGRKWEVRRRDFSRFVCRNHLPPKDKMRRQSTIKRSDPLDTLFIHGLLFRLSQISTLRFMIGTQIQATVAPLRKNREVALARRFQPLELGGLSLPFWFFFQSSTFSVFLIRTKLVRKCQQNA